MACDALASDAVLLRCCRVQRMPCGGPGGQHANKTATGVRLEHLASGIAATCCEHRDGAANRRGALARLRLALACRLRGGGRQDLLRPLVRGGRLGCGPSSASWPVVVATLLDALAGSAGELKPAAAACGLSTSQLAKALTADREVRAAADAIRRAAGLSPLRA